jgi:hypothetical protein
MLGFLPKEPPNDILSMDAELQKKTLDSMLKAHNVLREATAMRFSTAAGFYGVMNAANKIFKLSVEAVVDLYIPIRARL